MVKFVRALNFFVKYFQESIDDLSHQRTLRISLNDLKLHGDFE